MNEKKDGLLDAVSRRDFLRRSSQAGIAAYSLPLLTQLGSTNANAATAVDQGYEFAAGEVVLPFAYTAQRSAVPRPACLDFAHQISPDNCQVFVRIEDELWCFRSQWVINLGTTARYRGPDIDHMTKVEDGVYPPGMSACWFLGGMWYNAAEKKLYAPMHIEHDGPRRAYPFSRKIALATSTDKGQTWKYEGDIISSETYYYTHDFLKFSGPNFGNGVADQGFYVDERGGYFYVFPDEAWGTRTPRVVRWNSRAARCAISDKMAPGKWKYFYDGKWEEPALGGKSVSVSPGHLWGVTYSKTIDRYVCMFLGNQDPPVGPNIDGVQIGCCTDLAKQDWVYGHCPEALFGFMNLINADGTDVPRVCEDSFRFYSYFNGNDFQRLDIKLSRGQTTTPGDPTRYLFEPHPESSDPMFGRITKIVGTASADAKYTGTWTQANDPLGFEGKTRVSAAANSSIEFTFTGTDFYWRAVRSPQSGKAEIYIDGVLKKTVDCFSPRSTSYDQFVYIRNGLSNAKHTIRVVVTGKKHAKSASAQITHIAFEFSAESYRASAGFSGLMGKNNWSYRQAKGNDFVDLEFLHDEANPRLYWSGPGDCRIGGNYQMPGDGAAVREWSAPHGGTVRIEGNPGLRNADVATIWLNSEKLWSADANASHDLQATVVQGDALRFVVTRSNTEKKTSGEEQIVSWDPVVTYSQSVPAVWQPNQPSNQDLALNKSARSKVLVSSYRPFDAVDGDLNTGFTIHDDDRFSSGPDWLEVDLERIYQIDHYVLSSQSADPVYRPLTFSLQSSDDGFAWTDVDVVTDASPVVEHHYGIPMTKFARAAPVFRARHVRIYLPKGKPFTISGLELYYTEGKSSFGPPVPRG